jgi:DNA polymerase-3 subunit alpha
LHDGEIPKLLLEDPDKKAEAALEKYLEIFKDNFYIELQRHPQLEELESLNQKLVGLSRKYEGTTCCHKRCSLHK